MVRDSLLVVAGTQFYSRGFRAVSVDDIAQAAQAHKMAVYRLFGSKEQLGLAYASMLRRRAEATWERLLLTFPGRPDQVLKAFFAGVLEELTSTDYSGDALLKLSSEFTDETSEIAMCLRAQRQALSARLLNLATDIAGDRAVELAEALYVVWLGAVSPGRAQDEMARDASRLISLVDCIFQAYARTL